MKIIAKFMLSLLLIVIFTGMIIMVHSVNAQKKLIEGQLVKKGTVLAEVTAISCVNPMLNYDFSVIKLLFDALSRDGDLLSVALLDNNNIVKMHTDISMLGLYAETRFNGSDPDTTDFYRTGQGKRLMQYDFYSPLMVGNEQIGLLHIVLTNHNTLIGIRDTEFRVFFLALFSLTIGITGAFFLGRQISGPIIQLAKKAESVTGGNLEWDIDIRSNDEVGVLAEAFRIMTERLDRDIKTRIKDEKMAVLGQLSSILAHEIKNPLEPIKGSAELLRIYYPADEKIFQITDIIKEEILRLIAFIDNFLDFARPREPEFSSVDINSMLEKILMLLEKMIQDSGIKVDVNLCPALPGITGDSSMLKQVFLNIILNAIQASDKENGFIKIVTGYEGSYISVKIKDFGSGIDEADIEKVFEPFFTTKAEGSGTGLATSQRIVELHGGKIYIESEKGKWTLVRILLPY